jgi:uncharacterized membrane protein
MEKSPHAAERHAIDLVQDASMESFPASDPPSWIGMRLGQPHREPQQLQGSEHHRGPREEFMSTANQPVTGTAAAERKGGLTNALGWFSLGIGLVELAAPGRTARMIGIPNDSRTRTLVRALGAREIASGVGILTRSRPAGWMWGRVAGDAMDLALLGNALGTERTTRTTRTRTAAATAAVLGVTALDVWSGQRLRTGAPGRGAIRTTKSITVDRPPEEVYRFWRDFENLPRFMRHLESVHATGDGRSHWTAKGPAGMTVEWDAELTADRPNELIAWRSVENADVRNTGSVSFRPAPGGRGTEITVDFRYEPPGGKAGANLAKLFHREPGQEVHDDLRAFKQVMETGEVLLSDATVHPGRPHAAVPSVAKEE